MIMISLPVFQELLSCSTKPNGKIYRKYQASLEEHVRKYTAEFANAI